MGRPRKQAVIKPTPELILAYVRVSTGRQALGLEAQEAALRAELTRMSVDDAQVRWLIEDGASAKTLDRPKLQEARELLARGEAGALLATKIDRVSRSITDFIELLAASEREGWRLVITGLQLDTSSAMGRFVARIVAEIAQLEREMISERTSDALQAKKANGHSLGIPAHRRIPEGVRAKIVELRGEGLTYHAICDRLQAEEVRTPKGKLIWYPSTVQKVLDSAATPWAATPGAPRIVRGTAVIPEGQLDPKAALRAS